MEFRRMAEADLNDIFSLGQKDFGSASTYTWDWSLGGLKSYLDESFGFGVVCVENGSIVGFALVHSSYSSQRPQTAWLPYIFVKEEHRRRGIAKGMMDLVSSELKKMGKEDIHTDMYSNNDKSLSFFGGLGFSPAEEWKTMKRRL
jgi:ribosomal protein S18 acetylase RimI-like enzyme